MSNKVRPVIFGEVLFDCFPTGEQVLGGAPFNVAWHLQAFGDQPCFVSRIGKDEMGKKIIAAMAEWGMDASSVQIDPQHQTGRVDVELIGNEPKYNITPDCAYDFIDELAINDSEEEGTLYHGTLGLRNETTYRAFEKLTSNPKLSVFLDVNLRPPWWNKNEVENLLKRARWVKLNHEELNHLGSASGDVQQDMIQFQAEHDLELLIVTRGSEGAIVRTREGESYSVTPSDAQQLVDTVGAGDAFTAVFIHGLISGWSLADTLNEAQQFAGAVVGIRGATSSDPGFYEICKY